jgi:hypothetical protein
MKHHMTRGVLTANVMNDVAEAGPAETDPSPQEK